SANGTTQSNVAFSANVAAIVGPTFAQANAAANTVATFANGTLVLADANLNFNNTSTVNVSVTANGTNQTNIAFSANSSAIASSIANASTTVRGITLLIDSISSTDIGNAATANAVS